MPVKEVGELWTPRDGIGDIAVKGCGIGEFRNKGKAGFYLDLELCFGSETFAFSRELDHNTIFSTVHLTTNPEGLAEEGYSKEEAAEIVAVAEGLSKLINNKIA